MASGRQQIYNPYQNLSDFVLTDCFPNHQATIAIIGDWGTGMEDALTLLKQIQANFTPQVLIHLGDIYYTGLPSEDAEHFTALINQGWPNNPPLVFTLDGNHDHYAGTRGGYFPLIAGLNGGKTLSQPNSYFAIQNDFWQFVAMDTGYHDTDPFTVLTNLTYLEPQEVAWHLDKINNNGAGVNTTANPSGVRGTLLLSHHQLMSFTGVGNDPSGNPLAVNTNLANSFSSAFDLIDFWLRGHEHNLCIFQPYSLSANQPLPVGRCIGAGAVPVFPPAATSLANLVFPASESAPPQVVTNTTLANNGEVFDHAYAIVTLQNAALTIDYFQLDSTNENPPLTQFGYSDNVAVPLAARLRKSATGGSP